MQQSNVTSLPRRTKIPICVSDVEVTRHSWGPGYTTRCLVRTKATDVQTTRRISMNKLSNTSIEYATQVRTVSELIINHRCGKIHHRSSVHNTTVDRWPLTVDHQVLYSVLFCNLYFTSVEPSSSAFNKPDMFNQPFNLFPCVFPVHKPWSTMAKATKGRIMPQISNHNPPSQHLDGAVNTATPGPLRTSHAPSEGGPDVVGAWGLLPLAQDSGHGLFDRLPNYHGHEFNINAHHSPQIFPTHL